MRPVISSATAHDRAEAETAPRPRSICKPEGHRKTAPFGYGRTVRSCGEESPARLASRTAADGQRNGGIMTALV